MNRLKEIREDKDLLQKDIAKVINVTQTCYSKYEIESRNIPIEILHKLANFYNTSIDYLLCRTDKKEPYPKSIMNK